MAQDEVKARTMKIEIHAQGTGWEFDGALEGNFDDVISFSKLFESDDIGTITKFLKENEAKLEKRREKFREYWGKEREGKCRECGRSTRGKNTRVDLCWRCREKPNDAFLEYVNEQGEFINQVNR